MVSGEEKQRLRHNARHKIGDGPLMNALEYAAIYKSVLEPAVARLATWGIHDTTDPEVKPILDRVRAFWPRLSPEDRELYLRTAESIAEAERAKAGKPRATRAQHARLSRNAVSAAQLALEIGAMFPPPWTGDRAPVGTLIENLASFIEGSVGATFQAPIFEVTKAKALLKMTRASIGKKTRGINWELLRDLAWLASGKKMELPDERTIRRYLDGERSRPNPAADRWKRNWPTVRDAVLLAASRQPAPFRKLARNYLRTTGD